MREPVSAGLVAGAIAVTAGGGVDIVAEAREIAEAAGRFFTDLEAAGADLLKEGP